jgi:hypothetical protein
VERGRGELLTGVTRAVRRAGREAVQPLWAHAGAGRAPRSGMAVPRSFVNIPDGEDANAQLSELFRGHVPEPCMDKLGLLCRF